jgi:hypothetical protein
LHDSFHWQKPQNTPTSIIFNFSAADFEGFNIEEQTSTQQSVCHFTGCR